MDLYIDSASHSLATKKGSEQAALKAEKEAAENRETRYTNRQEDIGEMEKNWCPSESASKLDVPILIHSVFYLIPADAATGRCY